MPDLGWGSFAQSSNRHSFLRHPGLAQANEISGFEQGADLRSSTSILAEGIPEPDMSDTRKSTFAIQTPRFEKFGGGASRITLEGIAGGEVGAKNRYLRIGSARLFKPENRLFKARLQQMRLPNPEIPKTNAWISWTEANGALLGRDSLVYLPDEDFAPAGIRYRVHRVAVEVEHRFVFGN